MRRKTHKPRHQPAAAPAAPQQPSVDRLLWWIIVTGVVVIPCFVSPTGQESFRFPKLLVFRAEGIVLITIVAVAAIWGKFDFGRYSLRDPAVWLPLAIVGWTAITTVTSQNFVTSLYSLLTVVCGIVVFLLTFVLGRKRSLATISLVLAPAIANVLVLFLQRHRIWNPLIPDRWTMFGSPNEEIRSLSEIALQGNRNDVGTFLLLPSLVAIALALELRGRDRLLAILATVIVVSGLFASRTLSAIIALFVGIVLLGACRSWKTATASVVTGAIVVAAVFSLYAPLRERATILAGNLKNGNIESFFSNRPIAFVTALEIAKDHALVGVGPGNFGREYLAYKLKVDDMKLPFLSANPHAFNFGEAHDDPLQTLAEGGIPALILLFAAFGLIGTLSFRSDPEPDRSRFVRKSALAFAGATLVLSFAQFPMQLAAAIVTLAFVAGLLFGWSHESIG